METTLQFSRPNLGGEGFMDRMIAGAIMHETRSEICHVDIVTQTGTLIGAHAQDGIQERPGDYENWGLRIRITLDVDLERAQAFYAYAHSKVGTRYDKSDILGMALGDSRIHVDGRMICSQFAAIASDDIAKIIRVDKEKWMVTPEELRLIWASHPMSRMKRF